MPLNAEEHKEKKMYNYLEEVKADIVANMSDYSFNFNQDKYDLSSDVFEAMFIDDGVTGNASGSYTFNRWKAEELVKDNLKLCIEALQEFGYSLDELGKRIELEDWEYLDVTIRCYLLSQAIDEVLTDEYIEAMRNA